MILPYRSSTTIDHNQAAPGRGGEEGIMKVKFYENTGRPEAKLADAIVVFDDPDTKGCELHGFGIWKNSKDETFVSVPRRTYTVGTEERQYNFVRSTDKDDRSPVEALKQKILDEWNGR